MRSKRGAVEPDCFRGTARAEALPQLPKLPEKKGGSPFRQGLRVPELGLGGQPIRVAVWLVPVGSRLREGDRVVELLCGEACVELSSPASGRLVEVLAEEDQTVPVGQMIAWIQVDSEA